MKKNPKALTTEKPLVYRARQSSLDSVTRRNEAFHFKLLFKSGAYTIPAIVKYFKLILGINDSIIEPKVGLNCVCSSPHFNHAVETELFVV